MVQQRSRSKRRVKRRTPGGKVVIHYEARRKTQSSCAKCGAQLHGVMQGRNIAASKRRPSRPYGGMLCSKCSRAAIKEKLVGIHA